MRASALPGVNIQYRLRQLTQGCENTIVILSVKTSPLVKILYILVFETVCLDPPQSNFKCDPRKALVIGKI